MQSEACGTQTYFVYVKLRKLCPAAKGPLTAAENYLRTCPYKKGAGRKIFAPHDSHFAMSDCLAVIQLPMLRSGRQDLAALGTAAGKHLAAVGSSHSLPETVNLGTMTAAGLIGTLHTGVHLLKITYARQSLLTAALHIQLTIHGQASIL